MSTNPEEGEAGNAERREEILSSSPLLKAFLDDVYADPLKWQKGVGKAVEPIEEEFDGLIGKYWRNTTIVPVTLTLRLLGVFHPYSSDINRLTTVTTVIGLGYELGSFDKLDLFFADITSRLIGIGSVIPLKPGDSRVIDSVRTLLSIGANFHNLAGPEDTSPFNDFIEGLDI